LLTKAGLVGARLLACLVACLRACLLALLCPFFGIQDLWVLADMPDNSDLDTVLTVVLVMFLVDLMVQWASFART